MTKTISSAAPQSKSNARGQVMIEFALVLPVLVILFLGTIDLARAVYAYGVISDAARDGARWGSVASKDSAAIIEKTKGKITTLDPDRIMIGIQCLPNENNEYPHDEAHACDSWNFLTVSVAYDFQPITAFFVSFQLKSQSTMTIE